MDGFNPANPFDKHHPWNREQQPVEPETPIDTREVNKMKNRIRGLEWEVSTLSRGNQGRVNYELMGANDRLKKKLKIANV